MIYPIRSSYVLATVLALGACSASPDDTLPSPEGDGASNMGGAGDTSSAKLDAGTDEAWRRHPDAAPKPGSDAGTQTGSDAGTQTGTGTGGAGIVSCYLEAYPTTTCSLPTHCCFSNYSAQHDGECTTSACSWGTISCDGPEDCATGQHCCAHANIDPDYGITGYTLACQASACGAAPVNQELCHPTTTAAAGTCPTGTACVSAANYDYDLPRSLYICR